MLSILETLRKGFVARTTDQLVDRYSPELIEQKIREAQSALGCAKQTLATLILRQRSEEKASRLLLTRIRDLENRVREALAAGSDDLARDGAEQIARLEAEAGIRQTTLDRLNERIARMRITIDKANRRIVDLRQGQITANAVIAERRAHSQFSKSMTGLNRDSDAIRDAEALIERVMEAEDPFERSQVIDEIDQDLGGHNAEQKLAEAGFGKPLKTSADDVLARLAANPADNN